MSERLFALLDAFAEKISNFQKLFTKFQDYSSCLITQLSNKKLKLLKLLVSEWFICYLSVYDEFFSLYVGNIWLPRHMHEQSIYQHLRKGRDHAHAYKGAWTSKCSLDGIVYEINKLSNEDERVENRINQLSPIMDSFPTQFQAIVHDVLAVVRGICLKDTLKSSFDHQVERLEFR